MKSTGIVRPVDNLGRVVLPIELRHNLHIDKNASLEIYVDGDNIVLKKYQPACIFCGSAEDVVSYEGRNICGACRKIIGQLPSSKE
ncbi:AbrB/MazE/SpoVT family DNA-binding domain-containing protein [uncultured Ruthenibacterium sp.]|uniref:AbrB/MazE/SpoVT family DNA-binding domain-containing protein n=1 Tax=uncultured Ruthenibacterium sp. TaxID=1905347 RepID=UPI00349EF21E